MSINRLQHIIGGNKVAGSCGRVFDVYNPAKGEVIRQIEGASAKDTADAVQVASNTLQIWSQVTPSKRAQIMFTYRELIIKHSDELAELISQEHGKTFEDAKGEVGRGLEVVEYCTAINNHLKSDFSADVSTGIDSYNLRQPIGVCAGIVPFNFPAMVPMWMFPIAIACGCTFIHKPSEKDPSASLLMADLFKEAGLPDGVFNVVQGGKEAVDALLDHPDVQGISFVGSTPVAEYIYQRGTNSGKRVQALGGAKNHMVILPDADLDQVTDALMGAGYGSAGERCMAISVAVPVGEKTADALMERLVPRVKDLRVGSGMEPGMEMGPLITREQRDRVASLVQSGVDQGAELLVDGRDLVVSGCENGFFIGGCLFDRVRTDMEIYKQEIFGPVLATVRVESYEDAIALIEGNEYANGVAIFTRDGDAARDFVNRIQVGMVGVNVPIPVPVAYHSFGGWKRSLFGDYHIYGTESVNFYTRLKAVTTRWPAGIKEGAVFNFPILT